MNFLERFQTRRVQKRIPFVLGSSTSYSDWIRKHPESQRQGILYLIENESFDSYKIGITRQASKSDRIEEHLKEGWKPVQTWVLDDPVIAEAIEQSVLDWWRHGLGTKPSMVSSSMPQGGFTETIERQRVDLAEILEFIERQCSQGVSRPVVKTKISQLNIGVRSEIIAKITHAKLDKRPTGVYHGKQQFKWVYRYLVSDGFDSAVIESHIERKSPTKSADHEKLPLIGNSVVIEGRPHLVFGGEYDFGFIDPYVRLEPGSKISRPLKVGRCNEDGLHDYFATTKRDRSPIWRCVNCERETHFFYTGVPCGVCNKGEIELWCGKAQPRYGSRPLRFAKCTRCRSKVPWQFFARTFSIGKNKNIRNVGI